MRRGTRPKQTYATRKAWGRPNVTVTLTKEDLTTADDLAKQDGVSRSELFALLIRKEAEERGPRG
jgi:metal-responsive CopG/Arc/MetJ family transcriptional regulator